MLHLWLCKDRKTNSDHILSAICAEAAKGKHGQILVVPEQFSHTVERQLCARGGASISRFAEVLGFSRLADRVFSQVGGCAETETNQAGRLLMMSLAVEQVRSRLKIYGTSVTKPDFLLQLLDTFDEFRSFCVTADRLRQVSRKLTGVLAEKTEEFSLLMESFDAVSAQMGQNPETRLNRLLAALETSEFADGKTFYFDGFTDFNGVEKKIIAQLLNKGAEVTAALTCDGSNGGGQQFAAPGETASDLLQLTGGEKAEIRTLEPEGGETALTYLREHIFSGRAVPYEKAQEQVKFLTGEDKVEECRCAVGEMLRLAKEGVRWRDMSVACGDFAAYRPVLESLFRRGDIPAYFAGNTEILRQPVVHMLLTALEAVTGRMEQEDVLTYLKSGFVSLERERCDRLENYVLLWNIHGSQWGQEWTMHPDGVQQENTKPKPEILAALNQDRQQVIGPLLRLGQRLRKAVNTGQMVMALFDFTEDMGLSETLNDFALRMAQEGQPQRSQEYVQIYGVICDLMEQMYGVLGESVRTPEEFCRIFRTALSQCEVGTIPASLDCITVGSILSQRRCDTPYVFLLGGEEGNLPNAQIKRTLLTDSERKDLQEYDITLAPTASGQLDREIAAIDSVLNAPSTRLYLGAPTQKEAYLLRRAAALFPEAELLRGDEALIRHGEREYLDYLTASPSQRDKMGQIHPEQCAQAEQLSQAADYSCADLSTSGVEQLYGRTLRLSSSKIDTLASCRFKYFLDYGLAAKERKPAQIDSSVFGTFFHKVLEDTARQVMEEGGFHQVSLERTLEISEQAIEDYVQTNLIDLWQSAKAEFLFRRTLPEVRAVIRDLYRELSNASFEPKWFELDFKKNGHLPAVRIRGDVAAAELEGFVDRADVWQDGDRLYVRIVDYKTGKKSISYTKILNGLGLQMLLYLFALRSDGAKLAGQELTPAGVLYFPARVEKVSLKAKEELHKVEEQRLKSLKRSGMVLDSDPVLEAMEPEMEKPIYMPYKTNKDGNREGDLFTLSQLDQLEKYVMNTVGALADELYSGAIQPNPYQIQNEGNACDYCPYGTVCRETEDRWLPTVAKTDDFWKIVGEVKDNG